MWVGSSKLPGLNKMHELSQEKRPITETDDWIRQVVRASPVAMLVSRGKQEQLELINDKFVRLFGYTRQDLPDVEHWWPLAYPDEKYRAEVRAAWMLRIEEALRNYTDIEPMIARVRCKNGLKRVIEFHLSMLGDSFLVSCVDLTARKSADEALRVSEERFRLAAAAGRMYAYEWDVHTNIVIRSAECANILGAPLALRAPLAEITSHIHSEDLPRIAATIATLTPKHAASRVSYRAYRVDGSEVWLEQSFRGRFDAEGELTSLIGMVADISERKDAEKSLSALGGRLIEAQEQERRRIARDLHDDINQRLAILNIELQSLADNPPESKAALRERAEALCAKASDISTELSAITHELHSPKLELLGIVPAMRGFCDELGEHQNLLVDFRASDVPMNLPRDISLCLFRIFQEALRNAAKHSGVQEFEAELRGAPGEIHLKIRDQGVGFNLESALSGRGLGLVSMRERVSLLGGTIIIDSRPQCGTYILVRIPLTA
jgi:PAS domain S-box-containing protein